MKTLYLGTDPSHFSCEGELIHFPLIQVKPRPYDPSLDVERFTHLLFTSREAVRLFFNHYTPHDKIFIAIGKATAQELEARGCTVSFVAQKETQEGVVAVLETLFLDQSYLLWPSSSRARPVLSQFFKEKGIGHKIFLLYDTILLTPDPLMDLATINQLVFTSPSTVEAFFQLYQTLPSHITPIAIGPITQEALASFLK